MKANNSANEPVVAIEFVETLQEEAQETLKKCLKKMGAPEPVIDLARNINNLSFYLQTVQDAQEDFGPKGYDIPGEVVETINNIGTLGGSFGDAGVTRARKGTMLDGFEEE
jgi:hypothetical protein